MLGILRTAGLLLLIPALATMVACSGGAESRPKPNLIQTHAAEPAAGTGPTATTAPNATAALKPTAAPASERSPTPVPTTVSVKATPPSGETPAPTSAPTPSGTAIGAPTATLTPASTATPTPTRRFPTGVYYLRPAPGTFDSTLTNVAGTLTSDIRMPGVGGFDLRPEAVVYGENNRLVWVAPDGIRTSVPVPGLYEIVRPSFSPDGQRVAVQAIESFPGSQPEDFNIYLIDLKTGEAKRISFLDVNEESPEWFPNQNKVAYTSFDPDEGLTLHVYDVDAGKEVLSIREGGWIHLAVSPDGSMLFNPILGRLFDAATGEVISDIKSEMLAGLQAHGYTPDTRFPGQANMGTFPMDADFSPDGNHIVFDGAVERDGTDGMVIFRMTVSGGEVTPLTGIIEVNPAFSNNNNFSLLTPSWPAD